MFGAELALAYALRFSCFKALEERLGAWEDGVRDVREEGGGGERV